MLALEGARVADSDEAADKEGRDPSMARVVGASRELRGHLEHRRVARSGRARRVVAAKDTDERALQPRCEAATVTCV